MIRTRMLLALLLLIPSRVECQLDRDLLPLRFARLTPNGIAYTASYFDWIKYSKRGGEWAYCVTHWSIRMTADKDTVFEADQMRLVREPEAKEHTISGVNALNCVDSEGHTLPIAHAHPGGDCTPSRNDAAMAVIRKAPFELIICGPTSTVGYFAQTYRDVIFASIRKEE